MSAKIASVLAVVAALVTSGESEAGRIRRYADAPPLKDCTRVNGRWGYYGNIWCTPAEQLRWDRWDARRR